MAKEIFIVRHGQDEDNERGILNGWRDFPLTELGRSQAHEIASKLVEREIDVIWSSPLRRAHETAAIIAGRLGIKDVTVEPDLIERDFGIMTGKPVKDISKLSKNNLQGDGVLFFLEPEGGENFDELIVRGARVMKKAQFLPLANRVLMVTHGDIGKMVQAAYHGWSWRDALTTSYPGNTGLIELGTQTSV